MGLSPQIHPFCCLQCPSANAEQIENIAVGPDDFYLDICFCHGVFLSFVGALPPRVCVLVVQADALEVVVAFADFSVVCLNRLAVVGSLLFLFFASHANHLGVVI